MRRLLLAAGVIGLGVFFLILPALSQSDSPSPDSAPGAPGTIRTVATGIGAQSGSAFAISLDKAGDAYVAVGNASQSAANSASDPTANRIFVIQANETLEPFAGTGAAGSLGDGGPAIAAQFSLANSSPFTMGTLAAAVGQNGAVETGASSGPQQTASGIALNAAGDVCVADTDNATIRCIHDVAPNAIVSSVAGRWGPASDIQLVSPSALAADANGNLYISDPGTNAVLKLSGQTLTALAQVVAPGAIATNAAGTRIFVASPSSGAVFEIDPNLNSATADAQIHTIAQIATPSGLAIDPAGNLFIADAQANVIRRINVNSTTSAASNNMAIVAGTGVAGNSGDGGPASAAQFNAPGNLALDQKGNLFVADEGNHSIRELVQIAQAATSGVTLSPTSASFITQVVGGTTAAQTLMLTNNSSAVVAISGMGFAGANAGDFSETNNCGNSLSVGANCSIFVTFTPQQSGAQSATLQVTDSDPSSPQTAALTGTGDDFELSSADGNLNPTESVLLGQVVPFNLQVTSDGTFSGSVAVQCPTGMPALMTCAISPSTVNVTPGKAAPFTITLGAVANLNTNVSTVFPLPPSGPNKADLMLLGTLLGILAVVLFCNSRSSGARWLTLGQASAISVTERSVAEPRASHIRRLRACAMACALLAISTFATGCSNPYGLTSSSNKSTSTSSTPPAPSPIATPTGSYMLDVIGAAQNAARGLTITINVIK